MVDIVDEREMKEEENRRRKTVKQEIKDMWRRGMMIARMSGRGE